MELNEEQKRAIRAAARQRKRRQRDRDKQKRIRALEAQNAAAERAERRHRNLHFYAEVSPGRNATTLVDEVQIHREFLRCLGADDVRENETLREVARRTYGEWMKLACRDYGPRIYVPAFNRTRQEFDREFGYEIDDTSFEASWSPPKDCTGDEPIDVIKLPELPQVVQPIKTKLEEAAEPEPPPRPLAPLIPQPQPNAINFSWNIPRGATNYLNGG
jgi:hypothetical protein